MDVYVFVALEPSSLSRAWFPALGCGQFQTKLAEPSTQLALFIFQV